MRHDRAEPGRQAYACRRYHLRYRTPEPSEVVHRLITSMVAMRWPIATGSSIAMLPFQNHDELVSASLYKGLSSTEGVVILSR
jgi:hypothetical protein